MVKIKQDIEIAELRANFSSFAHPAAPGAGAKSTRQDLPPLTTR
jgi:hypothetical protein